MTIDVELSGAEFRRFTIFDVLRRRKQWRGPVTFAAILGLSAAVCFSLAPRQGAALLGNVLLTVGLGVPCVYFAFFFSSMHRQIRQQGLTRPQHVYTVKLGEEITASNGRETANYPWKKIHGAYRVPTAIYLYVSPARALILPASCMEDMDEVWRRIVKKAGKERTVVL